MPTSEFFWDPDIPGLPPDPSLYGVIGTGIITSVGYGSASGYVATGSARRTIIYKLEDGGGHQDAEAAAVIISADMSNGTFRGGPVVRGQGSNAAITGYFATILNANPNELAIIRYVVGTNHTVATAPNTRGLRMDTGVCIKISAAGESLRAKFWPVGEGEPEGWDIEATDSEIASGFAGISLINAGVVTIGKVSVGFGGDPAPPLEFLISGEVKDKDDNPLERVVRAHERGRGIVQAETISDPVDGSFSLRVTRGAQMHYLIALDEDGGSKNAVIVDRVVPYGG